MEKKINVLLLFITIIFCMQIILYELDLSKEREEHTEQCENIDNPLLRDKCYLGVAIDINYVSICEKIEYSQVADECYLHFAEKNDNHLLCEKMMDKAAREVCYYSAGMAHNNDSLCEKIEEQAEYRDKCYLNVGVNTKNVCLCIEITNSDTRQICFALITQNSSFCENIVNTIIRDEVCYKESAGKAEYYDITMCYEEHGRTTRIDTSLKYSIMHAKEADSITDDGGATFGVKYLDNESNLIKNATVTLTLYKIINSSRSSGHLLPKRYSMQYSKEDGYTLDLWYLQKNCEYCFEVSAAREGYESRYEDLGCIKLVQ